MGICSRARLPRVELSGTAPGGCKWTSLAAEYPIRFAAAAAIALSHSSEQVHGLRFAEMMR
eukprot:8273104-Pyramimonas_sp.AAC.1